MNDSATEPTTAMPRPRLRPVGTVLALGLAGFAAGRLAAAALPPAAAGTGGGAAQIGASATIRPAVMPSWIAPDVPATPPLEVATSSAEEVAVHDSRAEVEGLLTRLARRPGPAYRRYLIELLTRKALAEPGLELELMDRARAETNPELLAALGESLIGYYRATQDDRIPTEAQAALESETDPARQRALVRFLGSIPGIALALPDFTARCASLAIDSPDPETRAAAAGALASQAARGGSAAATSPEQAALLVEVAVRSPDAAGARRLLDSVDLRAATSESVEQVTRLLDARSPEVRRGAARALSGSGPANRGTAIDALARQVRDEADPGVRESLIDAIVRLDLGHARPRLARLRGLDPALDQHIDRYDNVLALGLSEWRLVQRELKRS